MQSAINVIFGTPSVAPLFVNSSVSASIYRLLSFPSSVTVSGTAFMYGFKSAVIGPTVIQGISPPKYLGSPAGLGDAPRTTTANWSTVAHTHPSGSGSRLVVSGLAGSLYFPFPFHV